MYPQLKFEFGHQNVQKNAKHTEKIDETMGMAILSGPIPLKIGVVSFCTLPLVATSQKSCVLALQHTDKMGNPFYCGSP
jgi:hypothetical protein